MGPLSTIGAPKVCGPVRVMHPTFDHQHIQGPYPSHSNESTVSHGHFNQPPATAKFSAIPKYASDRVTPPVAVAALHQVRQHDKSAIRVHIQYNNKNHLSARTSPLSPHATHVESTPIPYTLSLPLVNSDSLCRVSTATNEQHHAVTQPTRMCIASTTAYSELMHALANHCPVFPSTKPAGETMYVPLSAPRIEGGVIRSSWASAPRFFDWHASSHNDLAIIAPRPIRNYPWIGPVADTTVVPSTSRAHATDNNNIASIFQGCFEDCEPFLLDIMSPVLDTDFANGHSTDKTYHKEPLILGCDLRQQLPTTLMWQEARFELSHTYQHPVQAHPPA